MELRRTLILAFTLSLIAAGLPAAEPVYERVLVPLSLIDVPGAFGSHWTSSVVAVNDGDSVVRALNLRSTDSGIPARYYGPLDVNGGSPDHPGVYLYLEQDRGGTVSMQNLVFEASQGSVPLAALPVVRGKDFSSAPLHLLDFPTDDQHRVLLRIYDRDGNDGALARVRVVDSIDKGVVFETTLRLTVPSNAIPQGQPAAPAYAQLGGFETNRRFRIDVEPLTSDTYLWAVATITARDSGHVTVILPAH